MLNKKQGFGSVVSTLIMFIAIVGVSTGMAIAIKNYAFETQTSMSSQNDIVNNQIRTSIDISNIFYNSSSNIVYVYLKNIGTSNLVASQFDFFIDDVYIVDYTVAQPANISQNLSYLNMGQTGLFYVINPLVSGTHSIKLVSGYGGAGASEYFNT